MNDTTILQAINSVAALYGHQLLPIAKKYNVNLAIDNAGGDSTGEWYNLTVITPDGYGPELGAGEDGEFPTSEEISSFLSANDVVAAVSTVDGQAYKPIEYVQMFDDITSV